MMAGRTGRGGGGAPPARVTKTMGVNRFVWNAQHQSGLPAPPGGYQARLTVDGQTFTQPFTRAHRSAPGRGRPHRRRSQGAVRAQHADARASSRGDASHRTRARGAEQARSVRRRGGERKQLDAIAAKLLTEPVRYGKPGLQQHINYLAGMTGAPIRSRARCARSLRRVEEGTRRDSRRSWTRSWESAAIRDRLA